MKRTGVGYIGINAFLKAEALSAAEVISLPVPRPVGSLTPVFLHIDTVDHDLVGGTFVKPCKIPPQHQEICTHGKG